MINHHIVDLPLNVFFSIGTPLYFSEERKWFQAQQSLLYQAQQSLLYQAQQSLLYQAQQGLLYQAQQGLPNWPTDYKNAERRETCQKLHTCYVCLSKGHTPPTCKISKKCKYYSSRLTLVLTITESLSRYKTKMQIWVSANKLSLKISKDGNKNGCMK